MKINNTPRVSLFGHRVAPNTVAMGTANRKHAYFLLFLNYMQLFLEKHSVINLQTWQFCENCFGKHCNWKKLKVNNCLHLNTDHEFRRKEFIVTGVNARYKTELTVTLQHPNPNGESGVWLIKIR